MFTRRDLLRFASLAVPAKAFSWANQPLKNIQTDLKRNPMDLPEHYPSYSSDLIERIVTVAHFDLKQLKELIDPRPHLVKSAWDWGFGDWETPLGAACHMGRRDIAEFLLSKGASPSLFSWVLFGDLQMVQQTVEHQPGIERVTGPHSISLLAHARMGGKQSEVVLQYLHTLDADGVRPVPLTDQERTSICGTYRFGAGPSEVVEVSDDMRPYLNNPMYTYAPQLNWTRRNTMARPLFHLGGKVFYPAGAPSIEIRFGWHADAEVMTVHDGGTVFLSASRAAR